MSTTLIKGVLVHRTDSATLIRQGVEEHWIPDSVVPYRNTKVHGEIELEVQDWFLAKHPEIYTDSD